MRYVALGDSISIDEYPLRETGKSGLGAVSLFRRDLEECYADLKFENFTADGATTEDVLRWQLPSVEPGDEESIVTITAGGNDMLMNLRAPRPPARLVAGMIERTHKIIDQTLEKLPNARVFIGTVYDPSDGTNQLYGEHLEREAKWLAEFNDAVRKIAESNDRLALIDIHQHFLGHGVTALEDARWYWNGLIFEPNARGAAEVRKLWLDALKNGHRRRDGGAPSSN